SSGDSGDPRLAPCAPHTILVLSVPRPGDFLVREGPAMTAPLRPTIIVVDPDQRLLPALITQPEFSTVLFQEPTTIPGDPWPPTRGPPRQLCRYPHAPVLLDLADQALDALPLLLTIRDCPANPRRAVVLVRPVGALGLAWPLRLMATEVPHPVFGWTRL